MKKSPKSSRKNKDGLTVPSHVKIGYAVFKISLYNNVDYQHHYNRISGTTDQGEIPLGITWKNMHIIMLHSDQPPSEMASTLLHEIMHAAWHVFAIDPTGSKDDQEERFITQMSNALSTIMIDNPLVMGWIFDNLNKYEI